MSALLRILMIDPNSIVVMEFQCNWWNYHYLGWATNNFHCKYKLFILPWWIAEERFCFCCTTHINWWNLVKITNSYFQYSNFISTASHPYTSKCAVFSITVSVSRVCVWIKSLPTISKTRLSGVAPRPNMTREKLRSPSMTVSDNLPVLNILQLFTVFMPSLILHICLKTSR